MEVAAAIGHHLGHAEHHPVVVRIGAHDGAPRTGARVVEHCGR